MKFFAIASIIAVASAATPDLSSLPACSLACFAQGAAAAGCGLNDIVCQCTTGKDTVTKTATPCVTKNCSPSDQALTASAALSICAAATSGGSSSSNSSSSSGGGSNVTTTSSPPAQTASTNGASAFASAAILTTGLGALVALML